MYCFCQIVTLGFLVFRTVLCIDPHRQPPSGNPFVETNEPDGSVHHIEADGNPFADAQSDKSSFRDGQVDNNPFASIPPAGNPFADAQSDKSSFRDGQVDNNPFASIPPAGNPFANALPVRDPIVNTQPAKLPITQTPPGHELDSTPHVGNPFTNQDLVSLSDSGVDQRSPLGTRRPPFYPTNRERDFQHRIEQMEKFMKTVDSNLDLISIRFWYDYRLQNLRSLHLLEPRMQIEMRFLKRAKEDSKSAKEDAKRAKEDSKRADEEKEDLLYFLLSKTFDKTWDFPFESRPLEKADNDFVRHRKPFSVMECARPATKASRPPRVSTIDAAFRSLIPRLNDRVHKIAGEVLRPTGEPSVVYHFDLLGSVKVPKPRTL